ncbi:hypothetical protein M9458_019282, partial [Cirrhinus mrigala]
EDRVCDHTAAAGVPELPAEQLPWTQAHGSNIKKIPSKQKQKRDGRKSIDLGPPELQDDTLEE